jgi:hypothetical protein
MPVARLAGGSILPQAAVSAPSGRREQQDTGEQQDEALSLEGLASRIEALERENTELRNEVDALRDSGKHRAGNPAASELSEGEGRVSRKWLLKQASWWRRRSPSATYEKPKPPPSSNKPRSKRAQPSARGGRFQHLCYRVRRVGQRRPYRCAWHRPLWCRRPVLRSNWRRRPGHQF